METDARLCLSLHGELYVLNLNDVMCFEADDHYTQVFNSRGNSYMVPFCLARIEEKLKALKKGNDFLMRLGRKYIININTISHVNIIKQSLSLIDYHGKTLTLSLSKAVLRTLMGIIKGEVSDDEDEDEQTGEE